MVSSDNDDYSYMVVKISPGTTQLIASTTHPLFVGAAGDPGQALYAWISLLPEPHASTISRAANGR